MAMPMEKLSLSQKPPEGGENSSTADKSANEASNEGDPIISQVDEQDGGAADEAATSPSKKKRKPKKKAKKLVAPPTVRAAEEKLPWSVTTSARLGRHAVAKHDINPGDVILVEASVGAVVRTQCVKTVCHTCLREVPNLVRPSTAPEQEAAAPYKRFCSRKCALADSHAAITHPIHAKINDIAIKTQVDPQVLHLILELDSKRAPAPQLWRPYLMPHGSWELMPGKPGSPDSKPGKPAALPAGQDGNGAASGEAAEASKEAGTAASAASAAANEEPPQPASAAANGDGKPKRADANGEKAEGRAKGFEPVQCTLEDVETLISHWDKSPEAWRKSVRAGCEALRQAIISEGAYQPGSLQQFLDMAAVISSNAHGLGAANSSNTDSALGLYPALSMLNHSCIPNCVFAGTGTEMQVRAIRQLAAGEQLTVNYINLMEPRRIRARDLMHSKHFACSCERCTAPLESHPDRFLEAVKCGAAGCEGGWLLEQRANNLSEGDTWKCTGCGAVVPARSVEARNGPQELTESFSMEWDIAARIIRHKGHAAARPAFEALVTKGEVLLHPMHVSVFDSLMPLVNCCRSVGDSAGAIKYLTRVLDTMETVCGLPTVEVGNFWDLLGKLHADRANSVPAALRARAKKQAREAWSRALSVWTVTLGAQHDKCADLSGRVKLLR